MTSSSYCAIFSPPAQALAGNLSFSFHCTRIAISRAAPELLKLKPSPISFECSDAHPHLQTHCIGSGVDNRLFSNIAYLYVNIKEFQVFLSCVASRTARTLLYTAYARIRTRTRIRCSLYTVVIFSLSLPLSSILRRLFGQCIVSTERSADEARLVASHRSTRNEVDAL